MFKDCEIDGKKIAYTDSTVFLIQLGKGSKGSYVTVRSIVGNPGQAVMHYSMLNIGNGYKKRLLVPSFNKPVIAKHKS